MGVKHNYLVLIPGPAVESGPTQFKLLGHFLAPTAKDALWQAQAQATSSTGLVAVKRSDLTWEDRA